MLGFKNSNKSLNTIVYVLKTRQFFSNVIKPENTLLVFLNQLLHKSILMQSPAFPDTPNSSRQSFLKLQLVHPLKLCG